MGVKIYVGCYDQSPVKETGPPPTLHPAEFKGWYLSRTEPFFTNHPYVLDHAKDNSIFIVRRDGTQECLTSLPDYDKWKDEFSPGEIWSMLDVGF